MAIQIQPFDIGCRPSPSVPAETLLADSVTTYLLFFASSKSIDETGYLKDLGVAVLHCKHCAMSKFGYPNDEGLPEHPLYNSGLSNSESPVIEVIDSPWAQELTEQMDASARRIWGARAMEPVWTTDTLRHFVIPLKEKTFECLAYSLTVEAYCSSFDDAYSHVIAEFSRH